MFFIENYIYLFIKSKEALSSASELRWLSRYYITTSAEIVGLNITFHFYYILQEENNPFQFLL